MPPNAQRPPANEPTGAAEITGQEITPQDTPQGYCMRGDCRGEGCPAPCLTVDRIAEALERIADRLDRWDSGGHLDVWVTQ
jgi:hypothetical protein